MATIFVTGNVEKSVVRWAAAVVAAGLLSACGGEGVDEPRPGQGGTGAGTVALTHEKAAESTNVADSQVMLATAFAFLEDRNQHLMDGEDRSVAPTLQNLAPGIAERAARDNSALRDVRDRLARIGERYTGFKTDTRLIATWQVGEKTVARIEENSRFDYARIHGDEPPYTAFRVEREFTFAQQQGLWVLEDVQRVDPSGIAAINEVMEEVPPDFNFKQRLSPKRAADVSKVGLTPALRESSLKERASAPSVTSYNYSAMAAYASTWALGRNSAYRTFPNDCTNFISQAVTAGGWAQVEGWYQSNSAWWYNAVNQSYPWAGAENWYWFATGSGRTSMLGNVWSLGVADVLQMDFDLDNNINHTMMVTQISSSEIYLSYHSTDTLNRSLSSIIAAYPSAWYYAHRT